MTLAYLLDTNTCIFAMRGIPSVVAQIEAREPTELFVSSVTAYELYVGVEKCSDPDRETAKVESLLLTVRQIEFDLQAAREAARIRAKLESRGQQIGPHDVLIAGQAISLGFILVTNNTREFSRIDALLLEDWRSV